MGRILDTLSRLITARPYVTLAGLLVVTVAMAAGASQRLPPPETADTLPTDSAVAAAIAETEERFGDAGDSNVVTLIFRGDALTR